jgi:hypothetical protein
MTTLMSERTDEPWRRRLLLPAYQIGEAARYAQISTQTVVQWHKIETAMLSQREKRAALTYFQLIEVAVVAAFRKSGVPLRRIRAAREWSAHALKSEHPFAEYRLSCHPGAPRSAADRRLLPVAGLGNRRGLVRPGKPATAPTQRPPSTCSYEAANEAGIKKSVTLHVQ